jgi:hypothetical protein
MGAISAAPANTGGGGGGGGGRTCVGVTNGSAGGSGVVIVRYSGSQQATGGSSISPSTAPGYTVHTFTGPGTFTTNSDFGLTFTGYSVN